MPEKPQKSKGKTIGDSGVQKGSRTPVKSRTHLLDVSEKPVKFPKIKNRLKAELEKR